MNKTKLIAISGLCCAASTGCLLLLGLVPVLKWAMLFLGVLASVAVVIPLLIDGKNVVYSLLIYLASSIFGVFFGLANVAYVAPVVTFCMPFAIVKVCAESVKIVAQVDGEDVLEDPFDSDEEHKVVKVKVNTKPRMPKVVKWILYFVLLEVGIGLTLLATWLLTPAVFEAIISNRWSWLALVILQLIVYPYDALMYGCLLGTTKIIRKSVKIE